MRTETQTESPIEPTPETSASAVGVTTIKTFLAGFFFAAAMGLGAMGANASLIGDNVLGCVAGAATGCQTAISLNAGGAFNTGSGGSAVVADPGVEFDSGAATAFGLRFQADFTANSLTLSLARDSFTSLGTADLIWLFRDLDWVGQDGVVAGLTLDDGGLLPIDSFSFTDDTLTIFSDGLVLGGSPDCIVCGSIGPDFVSATFQISAEHEPGDPNPGGDNLPEPATALLFGVGLIGLAQIRRRRQRG